MQRLVYPDVYDQIRARPASPSYEARFEMALEGVVVDDAIVRGDHHQDFLNRAAPVQHVQPGPIGPGQLDEGRGAGKNRYYHKGIKQGIWVNNRPTEQDPNTLFLKERKTTTLNLTLGERFERWFEKFVPCAPQGFKAADFVTDSDLVSYLRLEAAYQTRSPSLLLTLKNKAIRWFSQFDLSLYTLQEKYEMIMRAVTIAMLPDVEHSKSQWLLTTENAVKAIKQMNSFLRGPAWGASEPMLKASAMLITC